MFNLSSCIDLLFRRISPDDILNRWFDIEKALLSETVDRKMFSSLASAQLSSGLTGDEIGMLFETLDETWLREGMRTDSTKKRSVFYLLLNFAQKTLIEKDNEPLCNYSNLLIWNNLSRKVGEDIFTTAFLAFKDYKASKDRYYFSWPPIISTNNSRLKNLLAKGIAENHFHLKGSAPHFSLSWICLMNRFENRLAEFAKLEKEARLEPEIVSAFKKDIPSLYRLVKRAAFIRALLFARLHGFKLEEGLLNDESLYLLKPVPKDGFDTDELDMHTYRIQDEVELLKYEWGKMFHNEIPDYAIPKNLAPINYNGNTLLYGERFLLYTMFKQIFSSQQDDKEIIKIKELFYTYLVIKEKIRQEFIQVNDRTGFKNFQKYQDRKEIFIPSKSVYEKALYYMSVRTSMRNQNIVSFETRITPSENSEKLKKNIIRIDNYLNTRSFDDALYSPLDEFLASRTDNRETEHNDRFADSHYHKKESDVMETQFYTLHFIKWCDKIKGMNREKLSLEPRDKNVRDWVKKEARAIVELRKGMSNEASRIRGIDAASSEIGCRPEVFAQAFRFLKEHSLGGRYDLYKGDLTNKIEKLGATFHVGEDFLDLADGLRAIDEAVKFLSLSRGDRLGHALALGIDPYDYYEQKRYHVLLPKQDLLDNIVWLLSRIRKYSRGEFSQLVDRLEKYYYRYFSEIYFNNIQAPEKSVMCPHTIYYDSWRLRGDNPMLYFSGKYEPGKSALTYWQWCGENRSYPSRANIREDKNAAKLYHHYHFNAAAKLKGNEKETFKIESDYIQAIQMIQKEMQKEIRDRGIGIEANPSSNYLIGCFRKYCKHPLINFFNLGLTSYPEKIQQCPQMFVSINTDDQGVFNTYLEKEYALMALALEREEDRMGNRLYNQAMIYEWLDKIRQMGLEQSFK